MNGYLMLRISLCPQDPAVYAHHSIIEVYARLANQMPIKTEIDVNNGVDQTNRVYENVLCPTEPNACNAGNDSNVFQPGGLLHPNYKFGPYMVKTVQSFTNISAVELGLHVCSCCVFSRS